MIDQPFGFRHGLDPDLFTLDRIDDLLRRAPAGKRHVRTADAGRERTESPQDVNLELPLADEIDRRPLHVYLEDVPDWAHEYETARTRVLDAAGVDRSQRRYIETCNIRVFTSDAPVSLHADGETQINSGVGGRNIWHFSPPDLLSHEEHESLLRGGQFLRWREHEPTHTFDLGPGDACAAPPRWPHWLEHPGPEPAMSFEIGFWTPEAVRDRKVYEVNWLLRKTKVIHPRPPREGNDALKHRVFDAISLATRKGAELRGV